jgi:hypothetical protein
MGTGGGGGSCLVFCATAGATLNIAANKNRASAEINAGKYCRVFLLEFLNQPHAASSDVFPTSRDWLIIFRRRLAARSLAMYGNPDLSGLSLVNERNPDQLGIALPAYWPPSLGLFMVGAGWVRPLLTRIFTSTRRFSARPVLVLLSATGSNSPKPYGVTMRRSGILWFSTR